MSNRVWLSLWLWIAAAPPGCRLLDAGRGRERRVDHPLGSRAGGWASTIDPTSPGPALTVHFATTSRELTFQRNIGPRWFIDTMEQRSNGAEPTSPTFRDPVLWNFTVLKRDRDVPLRATDGRPRRRPRHDVGNITILAAGQSRCSAVRTRS